MTLPEQLALLRRTLQRMLTRSLARKTDRPFPQLQALSAIAAGHARTQADLADRLTMDAGQVSRLVDRLEADGLLRRCEGEDRRCFRLEVTPAAKRELAIFRSELEVLEGQTRQHLAAKEHAQLKELLSKLLEGLARSEQ
jgi:MarR family transcriptional regulator, transcriptional regulator for hemolysin